MCVCHPAVSNIALATLESKEAQKRNVMKQKKYGFWILSFILFGNLTSLYAPKLLRGNNGTTSTFLQNVNCCVFHRPTQSLYVGLTASTDATAQQFAISRATPLHNGHVPAFTPLCKTGSATAIIGTLGQNIFSMALMPSRSIVHNPLVASLSAAAGTTTSGNINVINGMGTMYAQSAAINDSSGTVGAMGSMLKLAASENHIFAALKGSGTGNQTQFGAELGDGVAIVGVVRSASALSFTYHNVATGSSVNPVAARVTGLGIAAGALASATGFNVTDAANGGTGPVENLSGALQDMYYDATVKKLYITGHMTAATNNNNIVCGLVIFDYDDQADTLTRIAQYNNAGAALADNNRVIGALRTGGNDARVVLEKISVLHTSTGFPYLVAVGGAGAPGGPLLVNSQSTTRNTVYALPLVATAGTDLGKLAAYDITTTGTAVATGATLPSIGVAAQLATMQVGAGNLPIDANDQNKGVTWLECVGDTVFVSIASDVINDTNVGGVYYSQAQFNNFGKIIRWTDWAKAAPFDLSGSTTDGSLQAFAVSPVSGAVWGVEVGGQNVRRTSWTDSSADTTKLVSVLNNNFSDGCFSVFDLNQSVGAYGNDTTRRYALFGGVNKVAFALVSTAATASYTGVQRLVTTDFSSAANFSITQLPAGAGAVTVLGYSAGDINLSSQGFFFAGTKNGLYVWATNGGGVGATVATLGSVNAGAFDVTTHSWQLMAGIQGEVVAFKTRGVEQGVSMYVLTKDTSGSTTIVDRLYRINNQATAAALTPVLLATSGTNSAPSNLTAATLFYDCEVVAQSNVGNQEQVILATNNGLYRSTTAGGVQAAANQAAAAWTLITAPDSGITYNFVGAADRCRIPTSIFTAHWVDNALSERVYDRSSLHQLCASGDALTFTELPATATAFITDSTIPTSISRLTYYWSDGARRFHIGFKDRLDFASNGINNVQMLPFRTNVVEWNVAQESVAPISFFTTKNHTRAYWVHGIGASGYIMVGTDRGVISME